MRPRTLSFLCMFIAASCIGQQSNVTYTLEELTTLAQTRSARAEQLQYEQKIAAAQYGLFRRTGSPLIEFAGNVPVYNKDNFGVIQPDGTLVFRSRSQSNSDANFSIQQTFASTNTRLSLNTYLNRFDDYFAKSKSYNATLFYVQLNQPIFSFNQYKWDKRIEPLRYKESQLAAATATYELSLLICQLYYDVIEAEVDLALASTNFSHAKRNKEAEQRRIELGASTQEKVLQLQMMELEASAGADQAQSRLATARSALRNFFGMEESESVQLRMPVSGSNTAVSLQELLQSAERTHPIFLTARRELLEAQSSTDQAKSEGREVNIVGSFGVTNTGNNIPALFNNTNDQQRFSIGLQIPIYDGGRRKQRILIARENEKLVSARSRLDVLQLTNEITDIYNEYNYTRTNIGKLKLMDSIGDQRFLISNRLFETGKISVTELQISQREKDMAKRNYLRMLRRITELRYAIRARTGMVID